MPEELAHNLSALINEVGLKVGNRVKGTDGNPAVSAVTNLYMDANSNLASSVPVLVNQPTITGEIINLTGTPNADILTQTLVDGGSVTTGTINSYFKVQVVSSNTALVSSTAYYLPLYTLA